MPIYKHRGQLIYFAHVPRCAGTTIEDYLRKSFGDPAFLDRNFRKHFSSSWCLTSPQHISAATLSTIFPADFFEYSFAVVRNPIERFISAFKFQKDFEGTIPTSTKILKFVDKLKDENFRHSAVFDNHFRAQSELVPCGAKVFKLENTVDAICRYIDEISGIEHGKIPIGRALQTRPQTLPLPVKVLRDLYEIYRADFEQFGYRLDENAEADRLTKSKSPEVFVSKRIFSQWEEPETPAREVRSVAIKTPIPNARRKILWGDYHFARGLADAFLRLGHRVRVDSVREWDKDAGKSDLDLVLYGDKPYSPRKDIPAMGWVLYPGRQSDDLIGAYDGLSHVFFASAKAVSDFNASQRSCRATLMWQAFDPNRMHVDHVPEKKGMVFVGNNHFKQLGSRSVMEFAVKNGKGLRVWGGGWRRHAAQKYLQGQYLHNSELGDVYRNSRIVLCDHMPSMKEAGFVSNRIMDALACGTAVVTDPTVDLPDGFSDYVHMVASQKEFDDAIRLLLEENNDRLADRVQFAKRLKHEHSFDQRALSILEQAEALSLFS